MDIKWAAREHRWGSFRERLSVGLDLSTTEGMGFTVPSCFQRQQNQSGCTEPPSHLSAVQL